MTKQTDSLKSFISDFFLPIYRIPLYLFLKTYVNGLIDGRVTSRASAISFNFFIAFFPAILFLVSLIAYIPIDGFQDYLFILIEEIVPKPLFEFSRQTISDVLNIKRGNLLSIGGFLTLVFSANGVNSIISGVTYSSHKFDVHTTVHQYLISMFLSILFSFVFIIGISIFVLGQILREEFAFSQDYHLYLEYSFLSIKYLILFLLFFLMVCMLFYFSKKKSSFFSFGAFISTMLFFASSYGFGFYVIYFSRYNELYGSIGSLILLLIWIYINSLNILLGFEFDVSIQTILNYNYRNF